MIDDSFQSRPDQPERFDQQSAFLTSRHGGVAFIRGGNGSGKTAVSIAKVLEFLRSSPAPDYPFLIVGDYLQLEQRAQLLAHGTRWKLRFQSTGKPILGGTIIGGFFFDEAPPYGLLLEALRATRECEFVGNKICNFMPLNNTMLPELRELESKCLPSGWAVYRASTQCSVEAGHVSREWFDEFFSIVPESERASRMHGAWPEVS